MAQGKKLRSLRPMVLLIVGLVLTVFILVFFLIARSTMNRILLQAESIAVDDRLAVVSGSLQASHENLERITMDLAHWDQTTRYINGENPDYFSANWTDGSPLRYYGFSFLIIKDSAGNSLHVDYNRRHDEPDDLPPGLITVLDNLCGEAVTDYNSRLPADEWEEGIGRSGILFYEGAPYDISIKPAAIVGSGEEAVGTVILGNVLSSEFFRELTHYNNADFILLNASADASINQNRVDRLDNDILAASIPLRDIRGNRILLKLSAPRTLYLEGLNLIGRTSALLLCTVLLFVVVMYLFIVHRVLLPIERLSGEIAGLSESGAVNTQNYTSSREFHTLGSTINEMVERLNQSNISLTAFQGILNGMDAYLYVTDPETDEILFMNGRMKSHFGFADDVVGKTCWQVLQIGLAGRCEFCPVPDLYKNPAQTAQWEERNTITGRDYKNTDSMIRWTEGRMAHLQHSVDITDTKSAQAALRRRLRQQQLMSSISQSFIATSDSSAFIRGALEKTGQFMDADKIVVVCVDTVSETLVYRYGWHSGREGVLPLQSSAAPFVPGHPVYDAFVVEKLPHIICTDVEAEPLHAYMKPFGIRSFLTVPIYVSDMLWGTITVDYCLETHEWSESDTHLVGMIVNVISGVITREETEQKLTRMSSIVESSPQYVTFLNPEGQFVYVNSGAAAMTGYSVAELMLGGIELLFDSETGAQVRGELLPQALRQEKMLFELPITRKDGAIRLLQFSVFKAGADGGGLGTIAMDITEVRRLERELIAAKEQAEQSSRAKGDFLSRMSHEMRTPMNAIIGMTSIAKSSSDQERKDYCLDKIDDASKHLLGVINDILDMSKIEANKFELSYTDFNFETLLLKVVNVINFRVDEKEQTLIVNVDPAVPDAIVSDEQRLNQVITNLLSNAVKFTPQKGTITLNAGLLEAKDGQCVLRIEVADTGIGITEEQKAKLFHSFEQADGTVSRRFGGTGLGLAISKSIVEMMGGEIWVESEPDQGSRFIFTFRAERGTAVSPQSLLIRNIDWASLRILVADDSPDVREYFRSLSENLGTYCAVASDGYEAMRIIEESGDAGFHIAFVDWKMPGMDGIELTKRIKGDAGAETVVIMISATEWNDIEGDARGAGVDRFVPKPLFSSLIVDCVNECLADHQCLVLEEEALDADAGRFRGNHILLAEDIEINREIVLSMLEHTGLAIDCAENGAMACNMFAEAPGRYDMIFMDIHMPEVDGYEATRRIRAMGIPKAQDIPIVAMTANVFREDIERCLAAGMNDHVGKPIDIGEVIQKLALHLPVHS